MLTEGLRSRTSYRRCPDFYGGKLTVASPNYLVQQFKVSEPNEAWVTDIILHLHLVFSRQVIDWSMKPRMCSDLAIDAILMAF